MTGGFGGARPDPGAVPVALCRDGAVELDGTLGFYVEGQQALVMLNATASAIWARCDGRTGFDTIVEGLADSHGVAGDAIRSEVWRTLGRLAELGLVATAPAGGEVGSPHG